MITSMHRIDFKLSTKKKMVASFETQSSTQHGTVIAKRKNTTSDTQKRFIERPKLMPCILDLNPSVR